MLYIMTPSDANDKMCVNEKNQKTGHKREGVIMKYVFYLMF